MLLSRILAMLLAALLVPSSMVAQVTFPPDEPAPLTLGDIDGDGEVNFSDIIPFIAVLVSSEFQAEADLDRNGEVNRIVDPVSFRLSR